MKEPIDSHTFTDTQSKMLIGGLQIAASMLAQQMADSQISSEQIDRAASMLKANRALQMMLSVPILAREEAEKKKQEANAKKGPIAHPPANRAQRRKHR